MAAASGGQSDWELGPGQVLRLLKCRSRLPPRGLRGWRGPSTAGKEDTQARGQQAGSPAVTVVVRGQGFIRGAL